MSLFGVTSKEWRDKIPNEKGNIRDSASIEQLLVLTNLESMNAELIKEKVDENTRTEKLNKMAREQMETFLKNKEAMKRISDLNND